MITTNPNDPDLGYGIDKEPREQQKKYLVLTDEEISKGFIRPLRNRYIHQHCGAETIMASKIAETYARDPKFYGSTYCVVCKMHLPVSDFRWSDDNEIVGS